MNQPAKGRSMVYHGSRCHPGRLRMLLDDRLTADEEAAVVQHLDTCSACRQQIESLAASDDEWHQVRESLTSETFANAPGPDGERGFAHMVPSGDSCGMAGHAAPPLDFLAPTDDPAMLGRLGPYEISGVIGWGGMGIVLKGFDPALSRSVAVKVLAPQLATSGAARARFAREARAAAAVDHEHVMAIHAVDSARGLPYLVMPLVRGESLQRRIDRTGPLEVKEILRIGMQAAAGLAAAHAQGLVHRDIKPANLLLEEGVERVKITDFGLARAADDASLTRTGVIAGTPQYMAPEQAGGGPMDHRADLFSLGSVMYAMCTGRPPFRAETAVAVLRRICEDRPRAIRQINPDIPAWLADVIDKLHAKDPLQRFQTAEEVAELFEQGLAHVQHPTAVPAPARLARPHDRTADRPAQWRRHLRAKGPVLAALAAGAGLVAIAYLAGVVSPRAGPSPGDPARRVTDQAGLSDSSSSPNAEDVSESLGEAAWDQSAEQIRQTIGDIERGWHQPAEITPNESWDQSLSTLKKQIDTLERELGDPPM